ncbi:hypothetical protein SRHO_G00002320 [Serrasalmus rhombeus]
MGNEASAEGAEGGLAGLPAGLAPDGKGGFAEADLSHLSEDERKQLVAAMAKAQSRQVNQVTPVGSDCGFQQGFRFSFLLFFPLWFSSRMCSSLRPLGFGTRALQVWHNHDRSMGGKNTPIQNQKCDSCVSAIGMCQRAVVSSMDHCFLPNTHQLLV